VNNSGTSLGFVQARRMHFQSPRLIVGHRSAKNTVQGMTIKLQ